MNQSGGPRGTAHSTRETGEHVNTQICIYHDDRDSLTVLKRYLEPLCNVIIECEGYI